MLWILLLGILGLLDAGYLVVKARKHEVPVCPLGQSCAFVLKSEYNTLFGIKNETLGFLFYISVVLASSATLLGVLTLPGWLWVIGIGGALVMSAALTGIQVLVLRAYCSWCLASAVINLLLFTTALAVFDGLHS